MLKVTEIQSQPDEDSQADAALKVSVQTDEWENASKTESNLTQKAQKEQSQNVQEKNALNATENFQINAEKMQHHRNEETLKQETEVQPKLEDDEKQNEDCCKNDKQKAEEKLTQTFEEMPDKQLMQPGQHDEKQPEMKAEKEEKHELKETEHQEDAEMRTLVYEDGKGIEDSKEPKHVDADEQDPDDNTQLNSDTDTYVVNTAADIADNIHDVTSADTFAAAETELIDMENSLNEVEYHAQENTEQETEIKVNCEAQHTAEDTEELRQDIEIKQNNDVESNVVDDEDDNFDRDDESSVKSEFGAFDTEDSLHDEEQQTPDDEVQQNSSIESNVTDVQESEFDLDENIPFENVEGEIKSAKSKNVALKQSFSDYGEYEDAEMKEFVNLSVDFDNSPEYEISKLEMIGDYATVDVYFTFKDKSLALSDTLDDFIRTYGSQHISSEDLDWLLLDKLGTNIYETDTFVTKTVTFSCFKNGKCWIIDLDDVDYDSFYNIYTGNTYDIFAQMIEGYYD